MIRAEDMMETQKTKLAIDGGEKSFSGMTGSPERKIGVAEFFSIAERFGFDIVSTGPSLKIQRKEDNE